MVLFLAKKPPAPKQNQGYVPIDLVQRMAASGLPEAEIANRLSAQGFTPQQIGIAMRDALKAQVSMARAPEEPGIMDTPTIEFPRPPAEIMQRPQPQMPEFRPQMQPQQERQASLSYPAPVAMPPRKQLEMAPPQEVMRSRDIGVPPERIAPVMQPKSKVPNHVVESPTEITLEEIIEGVVADYWIEFEDRLVNFEKRDIQLQAQIQDLKKAMGELEGKLKARESDMVEKLENMGESMGSIQGRIGSIEKVFKEFLPQMTENVRTMADVVEKLKK